MARTGKPVGRPPGSKDSPDSPKQVAKALKAQAKEIAREAVRLFIEPHVERMVNAQVAQATGVKYLVLRDPKTKQFTRITPKMMEAWKDGKTQHGEIVEVWQQNASTPAFTALMDRYTDKPKETVDLNATGDWDKHAARLQAGRLRAERDKANK